jgi:hypothetical protein
VSEPPVDDSGCGVASKFGGGISHILTTLLCTERSAVVDPHVPPHKSIVTGILGKVPVAVKVVAFAPLNVPCSTVN